MISTDYKKVKFLIVDDFEKFRAATRSSLHDFDAKHVDLAISASDALSRIKGGEYDVIICDYHLGPGKTGQQLLEQLRLENLISPLTVFIIVTAENSSEMVMGAIECQPDAYIMKPFNQNMLKKRLDKILAEKKLMAPIFMALAEDNVALAVEHCQKVTQKYPKLIAQSKELEAELYLKMENYNDAELIYNKVLGVRNLPWAKYGLAEVFFMEEKYDKCIAILKELIQENKIYMKAYDLLAKAMLAQGKFAEAEDVLKMAISISPQAILRQMDLGKLAFENKHYETAEVSYRAATKLGKYSCYKTPTNYTQLVKSLMPKLNSEDDKQKTDASNEVFDTLTNLKQEYRDNKEVILESNLLESKSHKVLQNDAEAENAMRYASKLYETINLTVPAEVKVEMVETLKFIGHESEAEELAQTIVSQDSDNEVIKANLGRFIENSPLNSEGMKCYTDGDIEGAIDCFLRALEEHPSSFSINLNAIQAIQRHMSEVGIRQQLVEHCNHCWEKLSAIKEDDKRYERYKTLKEQYKELLGI